MSREQKTREYTLPFIFLAIREVMRPAMTALLYTVKHSEIISK